MNFFPKSKPHNQFRTNVDCAERARLRMYHLACHLEDGLRPQSGPSVLPSECSAGRPFTTSRRDSRLLFARQGTETCSQFMRPAEPKQASDCEETQSGSSKNLKNTNREKITQEEEPLYGKPVLTGKSAKGDGEAPLFARTAYNADEQVAASVHVKSSTHFPDSSGFEWCPRMDVVESGTEHVVTIELPGVNAEGIRVEIDRGRLVVTGTRSKEWWTISEGFLGSAHSCSNSNGVYHRRDISYGPYRAVWTLPNNANLSGATADFIDGFLRVVIPKV